jgi:hypothetical protein
MAPLAQTLQIAPVQKLAQITHVPLDVVYLSRSHNQPKLGTISTERMRGKKGPTQTTPPRITIELVPLHSLIATLNPRFALSNLARMRLGMNRTTISAWVRQFLTTCNHTDQTPRHNRSLHAEPP